MPLVLIGVLGKPSRGHRSLEPRHRWKPVGLLVFPGLLPADDAVSGCSHDDTHGQSRKYPVQPDFFSTQQGTGERNEGVYKDD